MKETKLIKFNIFLLILSLCIIFSVSLTRDYLIKAKKPAHAEEPGIPLETYLNGNYINGMDPYISDYSDTVTLRPTGHLKKTVKTHCYSRFYFNNSQKKQLGNLCVYHYRNSDEMTTTNANKIDRKKIQIEVNNSSLSVSNGLEIEYSLSFYKNGKNIYTKKTCYKHPYYNESPKHATISDLTDIKEMGFYVFCIHTIKHKLGHWDAEVVKTPVKNLVFAFQIGDGEVKTTVTGSNINGETKDLTNSMYSSKEEAEKHPIYTRTVPTITAETTYNQMSMICGYLYDPAIKKYRNRMVGNSYTFNDDGRQITMEIVTLKGLDKRYITIFHDPYKPMISFKLEKPTHKYDERRFGRSISELYIRDDGVGNSGLEYTSLQKWIRGIGYQEHGDINAAINDKITEEGEWRIIARDKAGNENVKYFTISNQFKLEMDKDMQPDNKVLYTNKDVKLTFSVTPSTNQQQVKIETYDSHGNLIN